jgi:hypothetical protein
VAADDRAELTITLRDGAVVGEVRTALEAAGASVVDVHARLGLISAVASRALVAALARIDGVEHVDVAPPPLATRD